MSDEKESLSWTIKLATLEEKINALLKKNNYLKGEIVIQLLATETSNTVSNKSRIIRNTILVNEIDHLAMLLSNVYAKQ